MPLVKTEDDSIHANYFPSPRKNVWTLFNVGSKDYSGNVLLIPHIQGAYYYDAWNLILLPGYQRRLCFSEIEH